MSNEYMGKINFIVVFHKNKTFVLQYNLYHCMHMWDCHKLWTEICHFFHV